MSYYPENDPHHRPMDNTGGSSVGNGGGGGGHGHEQSAGAEDDFPVPSVWRMLLFHKYIFSFYKRQRFCQLFPFLYISHRQPMSFSLGLK